MSVEYKDANGIVYKEGDIVFNPCCGDFWTVQVCDEKTKQEYDLETDFCLALYNDKEDYVIDIDEPAGFVIAKRKGEEDYDKMLEEMNNISKERLKRYDGESQAIDK